MINWRKMKGVPFRIQQNPGPDSAMGVLMLDSPNAFGVYLHDTPGKTLFDAEMRQKSNGCIRVEQMFPLASLALTDDSGGGLDQLGAAVATGQTQRLALAEPLPIYLLYWTAVVGPDGAVGFRPDFYGRDKPLLYWRRTPRGRGSIAVGPKPNCEKPPPGGARLPRRPGASDMRVWRHLAVFCAAAGFLISAAMADEPLAPVRHRRYRRQTRVSFLVSGNGGGGTLHFQGRDYPFSVGGLGLGGIGVSKLTASGQVYSRSRSARIRGLL